MKIAVFGYYNALNAGDDRIQYSITRLLQGHNVVFLPHYLPPPQEYLQTFDWILIGGGGLVFESVGIWVDIKQWTKKCKAKIGIFGLGVNRVSPELLLEILHLIDYASFFYVRDQKSKALLNNHPKVEVHPDLTWCFPFSSEKITSSSNQIAINLAPCHWKDFEPEMWLKALSEFQLSPFPLNFNINRDFDLLKKYFGDVTPQEFTLQPLIESQILVACRFHAIIFAMQLGKPFIAINYDEKVERLLTESNLSECCLETTEYALVREKIYFILANQAQIEQKISSFVALQAEKATYLRQSIQNHFLTESDTNTYNPFLNFKATAKKFLIRS
ncbi:polysaccharide pyruvyl transferase family protein [Calothrix sp. NIES-2098]|uniref:polysaccharide pyruvyl transferase family protein n=1 Tax=Calothrix sp. NIES-2098 TaxID=1954171 RepID=UPI000B5E48E6|nr:polysaccharide pyruvyl transferase [Calothrix sp. NIES-2098]